MPIPPSHYEILNLPNRSSDGFIPSAEQLKSAYRRALLHHHPDKNRQQAATAYERADGDKIALKNAYTIDQITEAYAILSVPKLRSEYDRALKRCGDSTEDGTRQDRTVFRTGSETVDLDELVYDEAVGVWYRSCRCGEGQGFLIREADLDEASDTGEVHVSCNGCSLWLRVLFGVVVGGEGGQAGKNG